MECIMKRRLPNPYNQWNFAIPACLKPRQDQKLCVEYTNKQKQRAVPRLLVVGLILQLFTTMVPGELDFIFAYALTATATIANSTLLILHHYMRSRKAVISHVAWFVLWAQLLVSAMRRQGDAYNELLGWAALLLYLTLATLPFHIITLVIYTTLSFTAYISVQYFNAYFHEGRIYNDFVCQVFCDGCILLAATLLGVTAYMTYENQHLRSYLATKRSLRDKLTIDQQSKKQEQLLLSVLPEHVAVQMRKDLGLIDTQFKKIYMSRHENVSILYADIVGFTAISSTYSAQDLVAILNELFARFDRLAEKYQQLRIKILGDCYYCISGAPVERPDHAVLCVHMGLSMVKAIKYVQQTTNSPVDMRVGIHTGAVLAGVLGQRQWQFDVYSRDVELANKMESSGMAGRVHVSEVTLGFLNDEFEVEPAYGEKREEMLRQAGIKTYFIVNVLKPYHGDEKSCEGDEEERGDALSDLRDEEAAVLSGEGKKEDSEEILILDMLKEELRNRDDNKELAATGLCLGFEYAAEKLYLRRSNSSPGAVVCPPIILALPLFVVALLMMPINFLGVVYVIHIIIVAISLTIFYVNYKCTKRKLYNPEHRVNYSLVNLTAGIATILISMHYCGELEIKLQQDLRDDSIQTSGALRCSKPSYLYHIACCGLITVMFITPASCTRRIVVLAVTATAYLFPSMLLNDYITPPSDHGLDPYSFLHNGTLPYVIDNIFDMQQLHRYRNLIMIFMIAFCLCIFDRYLEALQRVRHLRRERMRQQAEQAGDIRRRNQALVFNVLPPHVARHFMGARRNHRDLYSQSYAEVGVLFASMPNFTEFYSEETVNNQGLECLRFLNEVISDFDSLLEEPRFRDIIKIKTISSTYMAASGLNPKQNFKNADTSVVRWSHLMCLVEFALELQRVLAAINEQSFNHFVLRMGVNHGPITAGVIGAKKPHYDIWGNTVNVASRMESTGKAGCIQVTEETCHILEDFGYYFEQRGLVAVKGKGQLMTYYLQGKNLKVTEEQEQPPAEGDDAQRAAACKLLNDNVENGSVNVRMSQPDAEPESTVVNIPLLPNSM